MSTSNILIHLLARQAVRDFIRAKPEPKQAEPTPRQPQNTQPPQKAA